MINVRPAELQDLESIVALHYSSGVLGLLSKLTPKQLSVFYYGPLLVSPHRYCVVAESVENGKIVGVIVVSNDRKLALAESLIVRFEVGSRILTQSFRFPDLFLRIFHYRAANRFLKNYRNFHDFYEIDLLLVDRVAQSSGIGSILMNFFLDSVGRKGRIVVQTQNIAALEFYSRFGFNILWKKTLLGVGLWICERDA